MLRQVLSVLALLACASLASAQYGGYGGYGGSGNNPYSYQPNSGYGFAAYGEERRRMVIAHAVLASVAFIILFPVGGIIIRLCNFRGTWIVHAVCQATAYLSFIAGAGLGIYIAKNIGVLNHYHPIIGLVLLGVLFLQPFLGLAHHFLFSKHGKRGIFSYLHIWLGRIAITLGIINAGFGLLLASRLRYGQPGLAGWIVYIVLAVVMWLAYVICTIVGEVRRSRAQRRTGPGAKQLEPAPLSGHVATKHEQPVQYA